MQPKVKQAYIRLGFYNVCLLQMSKQLFFCLRLLKTLVKARRAYLLNILYS